MAMSIPHSATHSSLDIFEKPSVLVNFESGNVQEMFPITSVNGPHLEYEFKTDRNVFVDMQNIYLKVVVKILKGANADLVWGGGAPDQDHVKFVNNVLHSLFSNCEVLFNNELVYTTNGLYAHKAQIETEMSHTAGAKESLLYCQGYTYEAAPHTLNSTAFVNRMELTKTSNSLTLIGKLACDLFNCDRLLLPGISVRIRLTRSDPSFCLIGDEAAKGYKTNITNSSLLIRQLAVEEKVHSSLMKALAKSPAIYTYPQTVAKTYVIPGGQNLFIRENIFANQPIRRLALAMNTNAAFTGGLDSNPYNYQKFALREIRIKRNGQPVIEMKTTNNVEPYFTTLKSLNFAQDGPNIPLSEYDHHYILVFDLTSTLEAAADLYYPELTSSNLRLELYFQTALTDAVEVILLGERLSALYIDNNGKVLTYGQ